MRTVLIGIARMGSTRLPGKVLKPLGDKPVLSWVVNAGREAPGVDEVWIATSTLPADDVIQTWCDENHVKCFRGSETDVLSRFTGAAETAEADVVIRVTCDCPFLDPSVIGQVVALRNLTGADYASNIDPPQWPDGLDCEAMTIEALRVANKASTRATDRDCVTQFILRNRNLFKVVSLQCPLPGMYKERWVLDTEDDYRFCQEIANRLSKHPSMLDILRILETRPALRKINQHHPRNERFYAAIAEAPIEPREYPVSQMLLGGAETYIPLAAQTFSKSKVQFPANNPLFLTHGDGGYVFDVDGHDYVDMMGALLPVVLGYRDPDVDWAIKEQLARGISFSLATELEMELAQTLADHIPCAQMTRLGKSGTDVTTAAVRLARAYTGRDLILSSGYHGWADWAIGRDQMRGAGVPQPTAALTWQFQYGDTQYVRDILNTQRVAAVILEPETDAEFLRAAREACTENGTLLIFDEIITGFRWSLGGAQKVHNVIPDLACFGKAMGNGMPISALVGKAKYMKRLEPPNNIFYSGTFFGETLSIAAALATIRKLNATQPFPHPQREALESQIAPLIKASSVPLNLDKTPLMRMSFNDHPHASKEQLATLFRQEMAQAGVLIVNAHALSLAHGAPEIRRVVRAYEHTLGVMNDVLARDAIREAIGNASLDTNSNVRAS